MVQRLIQIVLYAWAAPYSLLGMFIGTIGLCSGGSVRIHGSVIEFYGGFVTWFVRHLPPGKTTLAITLGHTILGQTPASLDIAFDHEMIHVRQYERWGPLMGLLYLSASAYLWFAGRDAYRDNPFEREAYDNDERLLRSK